MNYYSYSIIFPSYKSPSFLFKVDQQIILFFWLQLLTLSSLYEISLSTSSSDFSEIRTDEWPFKYLRSPWLHNSFPSQSFSCDDEDGCNRCFQPSIHCERKMRTKWEEWENDVPVKFDELLQHSSNETKRNRKKNRIKMEFKHCNYLYDKLIDEICTSEHRRELLENLHLRSCRRFLVERSLSRPNYAWVVNDTAKCTEILKELLRLDNIVEELACEYESVLHRYDCQAKWSVVWTCVDCKLAYRDWLCSVIIQYHDEVNGQLIKPCQSVCEQVQQKCPHLHPYGKGQYAGEPVFLCIDPNIPFNKKITPEIPFGDEGQCYNLCDLEPCFNDEEQKPNLTCTISEEYTTTIDTTTLVDSTTMFEDLIYPFNESSTMDYSVDQYDMSEESWNNENFGPTTDLTFSSSIGEELDLSDNYEDIIPTIDYNNKEQSRQSTTDQSPQWTSADEDDYLLTYGSDNKQTQSLQYSVETDPIYNGNQNQRQEQVVNDQVKKETRSTTMKERNILDKSKPNQQIPSTNPSVDTVTAESMTSSTIDPQQTFQEIYREAMASTTADPFIDSISQEQSMLLNDELNKDSMLMIMKQDHAEWTTLITMTPLSEDSRSTTTTEASSTPDIFTLPATETERSNSIDSNNNNNPENNHLKKNFYKYLASGENMENASGNRFRHFNSRNKEKNVATAAAAIVSSQTNKIKIEKRSESGLQKKQSIRTTKVVYSGSDTDSDKNMEPQLVLENDEFWQDTTVYSSSKNQDIFLCNLLSITWLLIDFLIL